MKNRTETISQLKAYAIAEGIDYPVGAYLLFAPFPPHVRFPGRPSTFRRKAGLLRNSRFPMQLSKRLLQLRDRQVQRIAQNESLPVTGDAGLGQGVTGWRTGFSIARRETASSSSGWWALGGAAPARAGPASRFAPSAASACLRRCSSPRILV